jgi:hypothetical protein
MRLLFSIIIYCPSDHSALWLSLVKNLVRPFHRTIMVWDVVKSSNSKLEDHANESLMPYSFRTIACLTLD